MRVKALLTIDRNQLGALFAGHEAAGSAALKAIAICDMLKASDLALAAAFETFERVGHLFAPLLVDTT